MELQESPSSTKENPRYQLTHPNVIWEFSVEQLDAEIDRLQVELDSKRNLRKMVGLHKVGEIVDQDPIPVVRMIDPGSAAIVEVVYQDSVEV